VHQLAQDRLNEVDDGGLVAQQHPVDQQLLGLDQRAVQA
jgi:hypothetical protein